MIAVTNQYPSQNYDNNKTVLSGWKFKFPNKDKDERYKSQDSVHFSKNLSYSHESIFNEYHSQVCYTISFSVKGRLKKCGNFSNPPG